MEGKFIIVIVLVFILLSILVAIVFLKQSPTIDHTNPMQEYRWDVSESAPKEYTVKILSGFFEAADGYKKDIPSRVVLNNGWGIGRSTIAGGREILPLPKRFEVTWYDYRADTFYHGAFDLPFEDFQRYFANPEKRPYAENFVEDDNGGFTVGLAPEGFVVIWLSWGNFKRVVFTGKGVEVEGIPWTAVHENPTATKERIMQVILQEISEDSSDSPHLDDPTYWERLHSELYSYDIKIESDYTPYSISAAFLNKTVHKYYSDKQNWKEDLHSVMTKLTFAFFFEHRIPVVAIENISTEEMYSALRKLAKLGDESLEIVVKIEGSLLEGWEYTPRIFVRNKEESIEIKGFEFTPISNADSLEEVKASKNLMRYMNYPDKPATP